MRIALVIGADLWTGSGVTFSRLARRFSARGHDVTVVAHDRHMAALFREQGVKARSRTRWLESLSLRRAFRDARPDVVVADMRRDVVEAVRARGNASFPVFFRYNVLNGLMQATPRKRRLILQADGLIFQNRALERKVRAGLPWMAALPGRVIHAGYEPAEFEVDTALRDSFRRRHGIPEGALLVVANSEVNRTKGSDLVVRAVARAAGGCRREVRLVMLGRGDVPWIERVIGEVGFPVQRTGQVPRAEVLAACAAADLVVHPSREEIFPNAVVEAMGVGAAVVVSDAGGLPELVGPSGEAGMVVPAGELEPLAAAIAALLDDDARRRHMGMAARARLATHFPLQRMLDDYEDLFASAAGVDRLDPDRTRGAVGHVGPVHG